MTILYIGDIMAEAGIKTTEKLLPNILAEHKPDLVIAQAENVHNGRGLTIKDCQKLNSIGVDFFTGGNWTLFNKDIWPWLNDPLKPVIRPANYPDSTVGLGYKYITKNNYKVLVVSLLGKIVGKDSDKPMNNPLIVIDKILEDEKKTPKDATIVNFHGDYSSEKVIIGHYLDGKVTAVIGDHWHVATADARVLPKGTAHISDVGMVGALNSSLGVSLSSVLPRWRNGISSKNVMENNSPMQFNAVIIKTDNSGLSNSIKLLSLVC